MRLRYWKISKRGPEAAARAEADGGAEVHEVEDGEALATTRQGPEAQGGPEVHEVQDRDARAEAAALEERKRAAR